MEKKIFFSPENADLNKQIWHFSPSKEYKLVITPYKTSDGCWNYTQGDIYTQNKGKNFLQGQLIAEVQRNYSAFPFLFIEGHPNQNDYLICGEDYQGQTVIELNTGKRKDFLPKEANEGHGFCWAGYRFDYKHQILIVLGCHWACPYEFRFYDFYDPMNGWPEIKYGDTYISDDERWPEIKLDGTIKCYLTDGNDNDNDNDEEDPSKNTVRSILTFRRDGLNLILDNEWVLDEEQKRRQAREEAAIKQKECWNNFKNTDALYLEYKKLLTSPCLSPEKDEWKGITYPGWCPEFHGNETRVGRDIIRLKFLRINLEWAIDTGPIKVTVYGSDVNVMFFEHSVEGMVKAFEYAKGLIL